MKSPRPPRRPGRRAPPAALLAFLAAAAAGLPPATARSQDNPGGTAILSCTAAIEGAVACMAEKLCLCRFDPGGTLTGRPPRHRWDCGINRPSCGTVPADLYGGYGGGPGTLPIAPVQPQLLIPYGGVPGPVPHAPGGWR